MQGTSNRERLALYLCGLLPQEGDEAKAVIALMADLQPTLQKSRDEQATMNIERIAS